MYRRGKLQARSQVWQVSSIIKTRSVNLHYDNDNRDQRGKIHILKKYLGDKIDRR